MNETLTAATNVTKNIYFIDDSATMREVVKIAFRRESFHVMTCSDVASAVGQFEQTPPDAVISDVIMPDRDGYQLCEYVKQHERFAATPVILLSGIVNREVADKAHQARADELMRKPFHPQELVACVKKLLKQGPDEPAKAFGQTEPHATASPSQNPLSHLFGMSTPNFSAASPSGNAPPSLPPTANSEVPNAAAPKAVAPPAGASSAAELQRLRAEVRRLESLVKKLQTQLETEREYSASLESQLRSFSVSE